MKRWRLLPGLPLEAVRQLALDEVLLAEVAAGGPPAFRIWNWMEPCLVLGSNQSLRSEVDLEAAERLGYRCVRRMSGGGTMLIVPGGVLTYSLYLPEALVAGLSFVASFAALDAFAVTALQDLGVDAGYRPINDIVSPLGKIGGAAQARRRGAVLHHTTMALALDPALVPILIRIGRPSRSERGVRSAERLVTPLSMFTSASTAAVSEALLGSFRARHDCIEEELTPGQLEAAASLATSKYGTDAWLHRLP